MSARECTVPVGFPTQPCHPYPIKDASNFLELGHLPLASSGQNNSLYIIVLGFSPVICTTPRAAPMQRETSSETSSTSQQEGYVFPAKLPTCISFFITCV